MFKKPICMFITAALSLSMLVFPTFAEEPLSTNDALNVLKAAVGAAELTDAQKNRYDFDGNGKIEAADALIILRIAVGLEPEENPLLGVWKFSHFVYEYETITLEDYPAFMEKQTRKEFEADKEYLERYLKMYEVETIDELMEVFMENMSFSMSLVEIYASFTLDFKRGGRAIITASFGDEVETEELSYSMSRNIVYIDGVEAVYSPKTSELELTDDYLDFSLVFKKA